MVLKYRRRIARGKDTKLVKVRIRKSEAGNL
jgi:hypothetical protein